MRSFAAGFLAIDFSLYLYNVLKMSVFYVGVILAIGAFATPIISLFVGFLGDRYGRKPVLIIDLLTLPAGLAIMIVNHSFAALAVASALGGFGVAGGLVGGGVGASVGPVVTTLLAENTDEHNRTLIFSINMALSTFAGAAGALMVSFLSFDSLFLLGIAITLLSVFAVIPLEEMYSRPQGSSGAPPLSERDKRFIKAFGLTGLINGMSQGLITPFYPLIFEVFFHFTIAQVGYLMTVGGLATGAVDLFSSWFASRMGFVKLIIVTRAISATMVLALPFSPNGLVAGLLYLIATPMRALSLPAQSALQMTLISEGARGRSSGMNQAARLLASALSTSLGGALLNVFPLYLPFVLASGLTYGNSALYQYFFGEVREANARRGRRASSANPDAIARKINQRCLCRGRDSNPGNQIS